MNAATLLLGERSRFGGQRLTGIVGAWLGRADCGEANDDQLARVFDVLPRGWPVAAVTRQRDAGDAGKAIWVRADPAYIRPDLSGARLMAFGASLDLGADDIEALLPALKPLFGDFGFLLDAPVPSRWYLQLPPGARVPTFASPDDALGAELSDQIVPDASDAPNAAADNRRWRALQNESQVLLHNHPHNAARIAAGLVPVNSLWFWGAGMFPDHVRAGFTDLYSDDEALDAFARRAGIGVAPLPQRWRACEGNRLIDLRHVRDLAQLQLDWIAPLLDDLAHGRLDQLTLDFADGTRYTLATRQRWRFWRRPLRSLLA